MEVQVNGDAAEVGTVAAWHVPAEAEAELFATRGAEKGVPLDGELAVAGNRRFKADKQEVIAASGAGVQPALSRPAGHRMEVASEIEIPRRQENQYQV